MLQTKYLVPLIIIGILFAIVVDLVDDYFEDRGLVSPVEYLDD